MINTKNTQKKDKIISVAFMPAFGSIYYSTKTDNLLLIPTSKDVQEKCSNGSYHPSLSVAAIKQIVVSNKQASLAIVFMLVALTCFCFGLNYFVTDTLSTWAYLLFLLVNILVGKLISDNIYKLVSEPVAEAKFKQVDFVDDDIAGALKKKLLTDIFKNIFITLLFILAMICYPQTGVSYLDLYQKFMPANTLSCLIIVGYVLVLTLVWHFSPVFSKYKAYKAVKRLNKEKVEG